jgi:hypothetical protein
MSCKLKLIQTNFPWNRIKSQQKIKKADVGPAIRTTGENVQILPLSLGEASESD